MSEDFYRAFEERYYAPRNVITELRKQYLPFIKVLANIYPKGATYDAGCGRGEWLELMLGEGLFPYGVDLDDGMLAACYELDLNVSKGDAVKLITSLEDDSQLVVSAFHVVEHISFSALQTFIKEALRVLKPGGLLIMETPNPENIKVATENFYLDPTHVRPIPSKLLSFLPEFYGYERTKVLRLQEDKLLANQKSINLLNVIEGASPDYAVIAQKKSDKEILENFDDVWTLDVGLPLTDLAAKFENRLQGIEVKAEQAEVKAEQAEVKAEQAEVKAEQAEVKAEQAEVKAEQAEVKAEQAEDKAEQAEDKAEQAEDKAEQFHLEICAVYNSLSWQVTAPLRWGNFQVKLLKQYGISARLRSLVKKVAQPASKRSLIFVSSHPALRLKLAGVSRRLGIYSALKLVYLKLNATSVNLPNKPAGPETIENLTPEAMCIYIDLKQAIEKNRKDN